MTLKRSRVWSLILVCILYLGLPGALLSPVHAVETQGVAPYPRFRAFVAGTGTPLVGGKLYTYLPGTTTGVTTYTTSDGSAANTNPIILDSNGECDLFFEGYIKLYLTDSADVPVWTKDNIGVLSMTNMNIYGDFHGDNTGDIDGFNNITANTRISAPNIGSDNGTDNLAVSTLLVARHPYIDCKAHPYHVKADNATDDIVGLQACVDNAAAYGVEARFPDGWIKITQKLIVRYGSVIRGAAKVAWQAGVNWLGTRGTVLQWAGADNSIIVDFDAAGQANWDGIFVQGKVDTYDNTAPFHNLIGFNVDSTTATKATKINITHSGAWYVKQGVRFGNTATSGADQGFMGYCYFHHTEDTFTAPGSNQNTLNGWTFDHVLAAYHRSAFDLYATGRVNLLTVNGWELDPPSAVDCGTFIRARSMLVGQIRMTDTQTEGGTDNTLWWHIIADNTAIPWIMTGNTFNRNVVFRGTTNPMHIGIGNDWFGGKLYMNAADTKYLSIGDYNTYFPSTPLTGVFIDNTGLARNPFSCLMLGSLVLGACDNSSNLGGSRDVIVMKDAVTNPDNVATNAIQIWSQGGAVKMRTGHDNAVMTFDRQTAVAGASGGAVIDVEVRASLDNVITFLKNTGLMAP